MKKEIWKPIFGFGDLYEVSDHGSVRSLPRNTVAGNRWGQPFPRQYPGRMLKAYVNTARGGYRYINLHVNGQQHMCRIARLVAAAFIGPCPEGQEVAHQNGLAADDRAENLAYKTPKENAADRARHGTQVAGETHPQARLSDAEVAEIRRLRNKVPQKDLAKTYAVSAGHINNIQCGFRR